MNDKIEDKMNIAEKNESEAAESLIIFSERYFHESSINNEVSSHQLEEIKMGKKKSNAPSSIISKNKTLADANTSVISLKVPLDLNSINLNLGKEHAMSSEQESPSQTSLITIQKQNSIFINKEDEFAAFQNKLLYDTYEINSDLELPHQKKLSITNYNKPDSKYPKEDEQLIIKQLSNDCSVCYESKSESLFRKLKACKHVFCIDCITSYLTNSVNNSKVDKIICMEENCSREIPEEELEELMNKELFARYKKFRKELEVNQNAKLRFCVSPGCKNILETKGTTKLTCPCGQSMCTKCNGEWHEKTTCEEAVEKEFKTWATNTFILVRLCPKCKSRIEKSGGCNHMVCLKCNHQFCWICMRKYTPNHYKQYNIFGCPTLQFSTRTTKQNFFSVLIGVLFHYLIKLICIILFCPCFIAKLCKNNSLNDFCLSCRYCLIVVFLPCYLIKICIDTAPKALWNCLMKLVILPIAILIFITIIVAWALLTPLGVLNYYSDNYTCLKNKKIVVIFGVTLGILLFPIFFIILSIKEFYNFFCHCDSLLAKSKTFENFEYFTTHLDSLS